MMQDNNDKPSLRCPAPWLDLAAMGLSAACLAHCLLLPLVLALLPAFSSALAVPEAVHLAAFGFAVPASGWAMLRGYRSHGLVHPLLLGSAGLGALGLGALAGLPWLVETGCTVAGSLLLIAAHLRNWRLGAEKAGRMAGGELA